jgi:glycosyltransferase involved in cell wall biosynthesis
MPALKIAIVTDAWRPQTNGVVTTLSRTMDCLRGFGHDVIAMTPEGLPTIPCPTYPEIRLALFQGRHVARWLEEERPDAIHIATEGPLGLAARRAALRAKLAFTTSYHTQFPQYLRARYPLPTGVTYAWLRWFHSKGTRTLVGTEHVRQELQANGFAHLVLWSRGVDTELFRPRAGAREAAGLADCPGPILMFVGRVAVEKNVEDLLKLDVPGTKVIVGDGPALKELKARYPQAIFTGYRYGEELATTLAAADVFVFPSRTDTFGLVMLEAMASGVPVAAYPVTGPIDVVRHGEVGVLDEDLARAVKGALSIDRGRARDYALGFRWENASRQFLNHLADARGRLGTPARTVKAASDPTASGHR